MNAYEPFADVESSLPVNVTLPAYRASRACKARTHRPMMYAVAYMLAFVAAMATLTVGGTQAMAAAPATCAEDAPCWSWSTMGNHRRGVVTLHGNVRIVGPCTFARWMHTGRIAYSVRVDGHTYRTLERMRGDAWAIRYGCASA